MMKKIALIAAMLFMVLSAKAQDCDALVLPYFGNDVARMEHYKSVAPHKFEMRCAIARAAFYESDTVPAGADVFQITEVKHALTGNALTSDYVVDLGTLSYYAYNFREFQYRYPHGDKTLCFATPHSTHPYLVLRSTDDMDSIAVMEIYNNESNR